ncbi:MAG: hypothetical protein WA795_02310, partial [Candidatus Sulfotelmatobacter sp.]
MAAAAHLAIRYHFLEIKNTPSIDLYVAAVTKDQQLVFAGLLLLPANELGVAEDSSVVPRLPPLSEDEGDFFRRR